MASLKKRNGKYCVIYRYRDKEGKKKQKWETFDSRAEAVKRMKEIEYKKSNGTFVVPQCKLMSELLKEYVDLYGKEKWALSTYDSNLSLISNYIEPVIGKVDLSDINTRFLETYYKTLLRTPTCTSKEAPEEEQKTISTSTIRDIHKLLKSYFKQAVKWELIEKNPADHATVPKYKPVRRQIWTADVLMHATEICDDDILKLAMNLSFSASLRIGELTGLTWDCVDISEEAIEEGRASIHITKEYQRVSKEAVEALDGKDIILVFPSESKLYKTVRVLKTPKTETSIRRVFLPRSVAEMLVHHKEAQDEMKAFLGSEFHDYGIVLASPTGAPIGETQIRKRFAKLIRDNNLPEVVFHSLRHSSVTYKLKLNGGDIKAVQGDSGHAQVSMVTDVYSHIIDEDRRKNAELFEEAFYGKKNLRPQMGDAVGHQAANTITLPEGVDAEALAKVLSNPEMMALLNSIAKTIQQ